MKGGGRGCQKPPTHAPSALFRAQVLRKPHKGLFFLEVVESMAKDIAKKALEQ